MVKQEKFNEINPKLIELEDFLVAQTHYICATNNFL